MLNIRSLNRPTAAGSRTSSTYRSRGRHAQVACTACPYQTLGVTQTADDKEIKKAYRQLALKYHPDVSKTDDTERKFISIQEAYYILTGKARGKEAISSRSAEGGSWDFHDWIWQFRMNRSWDRQRAASPLGGAEPAAFRPEETKETVRTQLAGLRHRAAVRKVQEMNASWCEEDDEPTKAAASGSTVSEEEPFTEAADVSDGANYAADAFGAGSEGQQQQRPKFHMGEERRTHVSSQLAGLKRKGALKQRQRV